MAAEKLDPSVVEALRDVRVAAVAAAEHHSLALTEAGGIYSWGHGLYDQLGHGDYESHNIPKLVEALQVQH